MNKVVTFGELMLRLSNREDTRLGSINQLDFNFGGCEANVAVALANLGIPSTFISSFPNNAISYIAKDKLNQYNVKTERIKMKSEGRFPLYYNLKQNELLNTEVIYDRSNSSFSNTSFDEYDLKDLFDENTYFFVSGITLALSEQAKKAAFRIAKLAKASGSKVVFDFNYRSKLWSYDQASQAIKPFLKYVDYCFAGSLDLHHILGYKETKPLNKVYEEFMSDYKLDLLAFTKRDIINSETHSISGTIIGKDNTYKSKSYQFQITDRVGAGDAYVAGFIYSLIKKLPLNEVVETATVTCVLKHGIRGDFCLVSDPMINKMKQLKLRIER